MELRPYQTDLVEKVSRSWRTGHKAPCVVLPCGGGKSVIVADIAKRTTDRGGSVLFLVHRQELCEQIHHTFAWWGVNLDLCRIMMVQTACRHTQDISTPRLIITDENHHATAQSYKAVYQAFPHAFRVGVTATPARLDGSGLGDVNDDLICGVDTKWLIAHQHLSPYRYISIDATDIQSIRKIAGEYAAKDVETAMTTRKVFGNVLTAYQTYANGKKSICYCATIAHSLKMAAEFSAQGIPAAHIDGTTPPQERKQLISAFRDGSLRILCNVDLISEGFDVPDCECAILLRPTQSLTLYIQQSMRCMRYRSGKTALILDHVGNYLRHGMPDDDRSWSLDGIRKTGKRKANASMEASIVQCQHCFTVFNKLDADGQKREVCPYCGTALPRFIAVEEHQTVNMQEITGFHFDSVADDWRKCRDFKELIAYAKYKGYRTGWAWYKAKEMGYIA